MKPAIREECKNCFGRFVNDLRCVKGKDYYGVFRNAQPPWHPTLGTDADACPAARPPGPRTPALLLLRGSGASVLRNETPVDAVELFDRASLYECEKNEEMLRLVREVVGTGQTVPCRAVAPRCASVGVSARRGPPGVW